MQPGLIHVYCGDGKGKTTAALGLALRAQGYDWPVLMVQFLKATPTGELTAIAHLSGWNVLRGQRGRGSLFTTDAVVRAELKAEQASLLAAAISQVQTGEYRLLILDEIIGALGRGLLSQEQVLEFLDTKPTGLEVVLTGRNPSPELLARADYITEMKKLRHPFDQGIVARDGIER